MGPAAADPLSLLREECARLAEVSFREPQRLWFLLPLLLVLLLAPRARRARAGGLALPFLLRLAALGALLLVLLEPEVPERVTVPGRLLVLADVSPSVGAPGRALAGAVLGAAPDPFDLVTFGAAPRLVGRDLRAPALEPDPRDETDIAAALRFATVRADGTTPLRVVLLSDGRATRPGSAAAARGLRGLGAELFAVPVPAEARDLPAALRAGSLEVPPREERTRPFTLRAGVASTAPARVAATLYVDGEERLRTEAQVGAGTSEVAFENVALAPGRHEVQVLFGPDGSPADNVAAAVVEVPGVPHAVLLADHERKALLAEALRAQGFRVDVQAPADLGDVVDADLLVILPDAPRAELEKKAREISDFVGRRGGGLLAIGGSEGEGVARLHDTPLAFLLPLEFEPRPPPDRAPPTPEPKDQPRIEIVEEEKEAFPITLCLVVDRSGSMEAGFKLRQAKVAAFAAASTLTPQDRIALVAFGDQPEVVLAPRPAGDARAIAEALQGLYASGQTAMFGALSLAHETVAQETSPIRHVVLITDGRETVELAARWRDLVLTMTKEKITVSTVGIGMDVDSHLLGKLAQWGEGKYWLAQPHEIPQVVTQDTRRVVEARDRRGKDAEKPSREKPKPDQTPPPRPEHPEPPPPPAAVPIVMEAGAPRDMFEGVADADLPEVAGVEEGKPRFGSWVTARAGDQGPPLLAYGRVGLGTAAVLAVDPEAPASRALREHAEFSRLAGQLARSLLPDAPAEPFLVQPALEAFGGEERLTVRVVGEDGLPRTDVPVAIELPGGPLEVRRRADRYEAVLPARTDPVRVRVRAGPAGAEVVRSFVVPGSANAELARTGPDLQALLRLTGSRAGLAPSPAAALRRPERRVTRTRPLWLPFLLLAAILLPVDAWARRRARSGSR